jgi:hypothetical protein
MMRDAAFYRPLRHRGRLNVGRMTVQDSSFRDGWLLPLPIYYDIRGRIPPQVRFRKSGDGCTSVVLGAMP